MFLFTREKFKSCTQRTLNIPSVITYTGQPSFSFWRQEEATGKMFPIKYFRYKIHRTSVLPHLEFCQIIFFYYVKYFWTQIELNKCKILSQN